LAIAMAGDFVNDFNGWAFSHWLLAISHLLKANS